MHVNFIIANHPMPVHVQDFVDYVRAGVEDLGLPFRISWNFEPDAVNVMLDNFEDPRVVAWVEEKCRSHARSPLVIVATEVMRDGTFNSGGWMPGVHDTSTYSQMDGWERRTAGFRRVAPWAHAILCPSELLHASYVEHEISSDRLHYLPLVHFEGFAPHALVSAAEDAGDEDIDFLFTGVLTDRRRRLLDALDSRGFVSTHLNPGTPEYIRHHYMRRAKVYLAPKHFDGTRTLSKMRAYWALCHGYFCMVEAGTDPTDLDEHLRWFDTIDELVEAAALDRSTRRAVAADQLARFRAARPGNPFATPLAGWLGATRRPAAVH